MKAIIILAASTALATASPSLAWERPPSALGIGVGVANSSSSASAAANARANASVRNTNVNIARQAQGQAQWQRTNQANSQSNVQGTSINYPRQAPSVFVPNAPVGASSCMTAITFGGSVAAGGLGFSLPWADHRCDTRLNTVLISQVVGRRAAAQNLCWDDEMASSLMAAGIPCHVGHYANYTR